MTEPEAAWKLRLARTLWLNCYRARIETQTGEYLATLRVIPMMPLDSCDLPADAPEAPPHLLAIVEDAAVAGENLVEFEAQAASLLISRMTQPDFKPAMCQFSYPSPPHTMA